MIERNIGGPGKMDARTEGGRQVTAVTDSGAEEFDLYPRKRATAKTGAAAAEAEKEDGMKPQATVEMVKRAVDVVIGLFGTLVFLLAYPVLALLIRMESPGPVIYDQARVGQDRRSRRGSDRRLRDALPPGTERRWNADRRRQDAGGRIFTIYKFRTMRIDAEKAGPQLCGKGGDARVTSVGRILRKLHLDELPQFWNVLKGDMSFIGPRPERPHFTIQYAESVPGYLERTRDLKPGILGLAQIVNGYDDGLESVVRKTRFDLAYRASLSSFGAWLRAETWIFMNTFAYYATGKPLAQSGRLPAFSEGHGPRIQNAEVSAEPLRPALGTSVPAPLAVAARIAESAVAAGPDAAPGVSPLDALGGSRPEAAGLTVAMLRHRDVVKPTLIFVKNAAPSAPAAPAAEPESSDAGLVGPGAAAPATEPVSNFFTIDVECWFHAHNLSIPKSSWDSLPTKVVANVRRILDLLQAHRAKATFFVLGYVADRFPEVVRMIEAEGHEIGTHGHMHDKITDMTRYEFEKDLDRSLNALAKRCSRRIVGHRASNFSVVAGTLWALDILAKYGIEYDSSIFPVARERYGIPEYPNRMPHVVRLPDGTSIKEVPMSTMNLGSKALPVSGGGYLRLYPYAVTDLFIRRRNRQGLPAMVYLHPWEIDVGQARIKTGMIKSFQHYVNLDTTEWKLDRLLARHRFTSVAENLASGPILSLLDRDPVQVSASRVLSAASAGQARSASYVNEVLSEDGGLLAA